jgi:hypothetical protein
MSSYLKPLLRYWWLTLFGLSAAGAAVILVVYRFDPETQQLIERNQPTYSAAVQLLVTSHSDPYLRTEETRVVPGAEAAERNATGSPLATSKTPDVATLVSASNYLPFFIESDEVALIREQRFGRLPGLVTAQALFARDTPRGLRTSTIPIIQVTAVARRERSAVELANGTVASFKHWLITSQNKAKVPEDQRILVERLKGPVIAVTQESSYGLAGLAGFAVFLGFALLAVVLDRNRIAKQPTEEADSESRMVLPLRPEGGAALPEEQAAPN